MRREYEETFHKKKYKQKSVLLVWKEYQDKMLSDIDGTEYIISFGTF